MMIGRDDNRVELKQVGLRLKTRLVGSIVLLAAVPACFSLTLAQTTVQSGATRLKPAVPTQDFSGVWMGENAPNVLLTATNEEPPMTAWGRAQFKNAAEQKLTPQGQSNNDPYSRCDPPGVPRVYLLDGPLEIIQTPNRIFIFYEEGHYWREIWMDGRALPKNPDPAYMGYSVGKWADEMLVVDTIGFNDKTWLDNVGHPHSDALHVVERFQRIDSDTLQITFMFDDPKAFEKPWTAAPRILKAMPGRELLESFCVQNDSRSSGKK
jgi:hypothetical protein